jgi:hypothetical protein
LAFPRNGVDEDMLEEYAQCLRLLFDPERRRANFPKPPAAARPHLDRRTGREAHCCA